MTADLIIKNANVFMTYRQCFEKRDVAVAGEKFYCVSPAISYPGVREIDGDRKSTRLNSSHSGGSRMPSSA